MMATVPTAGKLIAVAPSDPLAPETFSGLSPALFSTIRSLGVEIVPVTARQLHWYDALTGAVNPVSLVLGAGPRRPLIRPNWSWSRRGFERYCRRFDKILARVEPTSRTVLQVGTQIRIDRGGYRLFSITDTTVSQAVEAGEFSVSHGSARTVAEALDCQREVFEASEKIFTLSAWAADSVVEDYGLSRDRVVVMGAGPNLPDPPARRRDVRAPLILLMGRDWERKGGSLLLEAFREVHSQTPEARLAIVGCEPKIQEPGVEVVGLLDRSDSDQYARLREFFATATCLAVCSRFDPFPNVILEAAACGLPTVAIAGQSRAEVVRHEQTGLLVDRPDPRLLAAALSRVISEPGLADRLGARARALVDSELNWPRVAARLLDEMDLSPH